jgi:nucleoside-diphosphate-sugar epimerase
MERSMTDERDRILLTGATGYVGGRLLQVLEREHHPVRCLTRRPSASCGLCPIAGCSSLPR